MAAPRSDELTIPFARDERARQGFVSQLRAYVLVDMANAMKGHYADTVKPRLEATKGGPVASQDEVHDAMKSEPLFRFYSAVRVNAQEMVWRSVIPPVEKALSGLTDRSGALTARNPAGGSLTLDPAVKIPSNVAGLDVHLMPGGYAPADTLAAGAVYDNGFEVFAAGFMGESLSFANYVKHRYPDFQPRDVLDCGCTIGHNTTPWKQAFPGADVQGIDVSAATLSYAHARAEGLGITAHFTQMDATRLTFADNSFDVVFSSMFLHELSLKDIAAYFKEAHRVLRPGGLFLTMELPPNKELDPYDQFYLDWDCYYNKEPYYRKFRDQDPRALTAAAGFASPDYIQFVAPQYSFTPEAAFAEAVNEEDAIGGETGRLTDGLKWFGFGAWKA
jgi:ubiquinone/menaquinone biosynthesis C-methylase UbiE